MQEASRQALIIANSHYTDTKLSKLSAPEIDAKSLQAVLRDSNIGFFDNVQVVTNVDSQRVREEIDRFFSGKKRDDTLLLYFSGHGVLDSNGRLYLAAANTNTQHLPSTGVSAQFISDLMDGSRSKRQILILDCCHSGAFARNSRATVDRTVGTGTAFKGDGTGRVILTATDSTQYAWEGDELIRGGGGARFTYYLVEGLKTGNADRDRKGHITVDDLYHYVYEKVKANSPEEKPQTPHQWSFNRKGNLIIAKSPMAIKKRKPPKSIRPGLIRRFLQAHLSLDDVRDICLDLHIDEQTIGIGSEKSEIAFKLLQVIQDSGRWEDLLDALWDYYQEPFRNQFGERPNVAVRGGVRQPPKPTTKPVRRKTSPKTNIPPPIYGIEWIEVAAGEFWMGAIDEDKDAYDDEKPGHPLYLPRFWIAKTPITNAQYAPFVQAGKGTPPEHWKGNQPPKEIQDHPVVYVNWEEAVAYCAWLSQSLDLDVTLPSEAEWEKAAGWDAQNNKRLIYPWGIQYHKGYCNDNNSGIDGTSPVTRFAKRASPYGALDLAGNVWEWTRSLWGKKFEKYPYDPFDDRENMNERAGLRALRGGSFRSGPRAGRVSNRNGRGIDACDFNVGFRVVVHPPSQ